MLWRRATGLRLAVAGLLVLSFGVQAMPARSATHVGRCAPALATSPPLAETLALPSGRGEGLAAVDRRERSPAPVAGVDDLSVASTRPAIRALPPLPPHARSHPARHLPPRRAADDPPPH